MTSRCTADLFDMRIYFTDNAFSTRRRIINMATCSLLMSSTSDAVISSTKRECDLMLLNACFLEIILSRFSINRFGLYYLRDFQLTDEEMKSYRLEFIDRFNLAAQQFMEVARFCE